MHTSAGRKRRDASRQGEVGGSRSEGPNAGHTAAVPGLEGNPRHRVADAVRSRIPTASHLRAGTALHSLLLVAGVPHARGPAQDGCTRPSNHPGPPRSGRATNRGSRGPREAPRWPERPGTGRCSPRTGRPQSLDPTLAWPPQPLRYSRSFRLSIRIYGPSHRASGPGPGPLKPDSPDRNHGALGGPPIVEPFRNARPCLRRTGR